MSNRKILDSFQLKLIAIITMTIDHIGMFLISYSGATISKILEDFSKYPMGSTGFIFKCVGRIAFPLFALLVAEAMIYSKNKEKYLIRLSIMAGIVIVAQVFVNYILPFDFSINGNNIFLTLLSGASFIYFINKKDYKKLLILIPLFFVILSTVCDFKAISGITILWWPKCLRCDYSIYGFLLIIGFYYSYKLSDRFIINFATENGLEHNFDNLKTLPKYRNFNNIMWSLNLLLVTTLFWVLSYINPKLDIYYMDIQEWVLVAIIPIVLYNGKKGYNSNIIKYGFYIYYPLHLIIIFLGFYLGFGYIAK